MHACIDLLGLHQSRAELLDLCVHARGRAAGLVQFSKQLGIVLDVAGHVGACCGDRDCWPAPGSAFHTPRLAGQIRIRRVSWSSVSACAWAPVRGMGPYH